MADRDDELSRLRDDLEGAVRAARDAEAELGRVRGELAEMHVQLIRARQDQERYQGLLDARRSLAGRIEGVHRRFGRLRRR